MQTSNKVQKTKHGKILNYMKKAKMTDDMELNREGREA